MDKKKNEKNTFSERHPKLNMLIGIILLLIIVGIAILVLYAFFKYAGELIKGLAKLDAVVIVALITGAVSISGVVISSIIGKSLEFKKSRNEYLAQKREAPYCDFVEMVYKIQLNAKNDGDYTTEEMAKDISKFSRQLTLWGSPEVAKKWYEFRKNGADPQKALDNFWLTEEIMNEMRKDMGTKKVKKGGLLGFFVNDIDSVSK